MTLVRLVRANSKGPLNGAFFFALMEHDLLFDRDNTVYAVNCRVEGPALHCGALYLEPLIPRQFIRISDSGATVEIELPAEMLNQPSAFRAWNIDLPIRAES